MTTVTEASSYGDAIRIRNQIDATVNKLVTLSLTLAGQAVDWANVHVDGVNARAAAGQVIAAGSSSSTAHVMCDWQLTLTDFKKVT